MSFKLSRVHYFSLLFLFTIASCQGPSVHSDRSPQSVDELYREAKQELAEVDSRIEQEKFVKIEGARIAYANYPLIRRDFPALSSLSEDQIDQWLIDHAAYMSKPNAKTQTANTVVPVNFSEQITGHRPPRYGRAAIFEADFQGQKIGLLDTKGIGHFLSARAEPKGDGLATLGELLREVLFERFVGMMLKDSNQGRSVVGSYAIIDPGFEVKFGDGATKPAGILIRQAHDRQTDHGFLSRPQEIMDLSEVFNRYGIVTHNNIQGTKGGDLFDFGHMYVEIGLGDPELGARSERWGYNPEWVSGLDSVDQFSPSIVDGPSQAANDLALALSQGEVSREQVNKFFESYLTELKMPHLVSNSSCYELLRALL